MLENYQQRYLSSQLKTAITYHQQGNLKKAEALYKTMPQNPEALNLRSVIAHQFSQYQKALDLLTKAIHIFPNNAEFYCNMGMAYEGLNRYMDAEASYRKALELAPEFALVHNNLGNALIEQSRLEEAEASYRMAIDHAPDFAMAHNNLGFLYQKKGMRDEAINCYRQAIALDTTYAEAYGNLGSVLKDQGKLSEAVINFEHALKLQPNFTQALNNLGTALISQCQIDAAIRCFQHLLKLDPGFADAHSNLLFCYNYHPTLSAGEIYHAYQQWNAQHAAKLTSAAASHRNHPDPTRRLKIGYVSPDFRNHSVIHFAGPLISQHDRSRFEVFCYYNHIQQDSYTNQLMTSGTHWIPCNHLSHAQLAQRIRDDEIDILIDLAGHTAGNRLLAFARKPAPVQVSWLGFGYTTGLTAMDYFIGDPIFTPSEAQPYFSEKLICLPQRTAIYQPPDNVPDVNSSPALKNGYVTFVCLSRSERINSRVIETWASILQNIPNAHLRIDSRNFSDDGLRESFLNQFAAFGITKERLEIGFTTPAWDVYQSADIALDCFPHNSGTTNYEALWMGLPVITLADRPSVGRSGASLLTCIGKTEWIATNTSDYIKHAVELAQNHPLLAQERQSLREIMRNSPLTDQATFIQDMEQAYLEMWQTWCHTNFQHKF